MAHKHIHPQALAFAVETTPCVAPADWTAETAIEFISVDLSGVKETLVADVTAERRTMAVGDREMVHGIRNCTASIVAAVPHHIATAASPPPPPAAGATLSRKP